jgi:PAS domain S-box-containing protein
MAAQLSPTPLARRLVDRYLMFGLAGLFAFLSLAIVLAWRGTFTQFVAVTAVLPLLMLLVGAFVLRRTVRLSEAIEQQLQQIATVSSTLDATLEPLAAPGPAAAGWNALLAQLRERRTLDMLESRLNSTLAPREEKRWEAIVNHLTDGVAVCNAELVITCGNTSLAAMFGVESPEKLVGRKILELLIEKGAAEKTGMLEQLSHGSGKLTCDFLRGAELAAGVWRLTRFPLHGEAFRDGGTLWTLRDVTQQKLAEDARNQFVYTATHELRTPLANIRAYAETLALEDGIDEEKQKSFFNIINSEATRLGHFIDDLLNVSQMEAGSITIVRHETDIERLLGEVIEHVRPQIEQKELKFESQQPAKLPKLKVDKSKLAAALVNLLGNAIKYTPAGGNVKLHVEHEASQIHFHVEDTGIGIAAEELPRLCEKFFRSEDARVREITGSGLGLAFTQEVARLHGGRLTARSELDKGSRFSLTLPLP